MSKEEFFKEEIEEAIEMSELGYFNTNPDADDEEEESIFFEED